MNNTPELIVMLTLNDRTAENAYEIFDRCKDAKAKIWGFKEEGLPPERMKELYSYMKERGKTTALEVVAYTEDLCMKGAELAAECGCDILMGTTFSDRINDFCKRAGLKYMPFVGEVSGRPSILDGSVEKMIGDAALYLQKGVYGIDLLGYRYLNDASALIEEFVSKTDAPVCIAGSVNSYARLDEIKRISPWAFTIGSAFFENRFGDGFAEQIDGVYDYINAEHPNARREN